jgi:hypothetical protein
MTPTQERIRKALRSPLAVALPLGAALVIPVMPSVSAPRLPAVASGITRASVLQAAILPVADAQSARSGGPRPGALAGPPALPGRGWPSDLTSAAQERAALVTAQQAAVRAAYLHQLAVIQAQQRAAAAARARAVAAAARASAPAAAAPVAASAPVPVQSAPAPSGSLQAYAMSLVGATQFYCVNNIFIRESGWRWNAQNPYSAAYGVPQANPGSKMASAGADWATNPYTQIRWGISYMDSTYGSPCGAWAFWQAHSSY